MKNLPGFTGIFALVSMLVVSTPAFSQRQAPPEVPKARPDATIKVTRQSGTCPSAVSLWTSFRYYEGGGEHTVIADTSAIAGSARLVRSTNKFAEFSAPLKSNFASCVGQATSQEETTNLYSFRFQNKNVIFRVQLPSDTPSNPSEITYKNVVTSRPAVRWAIAD